MKRLCFFLTFGMVSISFAQHSTRLIKANWMFRQDSTEKFFKANVPGTVHQDLYNNGLIPDPYFSTNAEQLNWIEDKTWEYKTVFEISDIEFSKEKIEIEFEGLDTYAQVYLNNVLLLSADNMFRSWLIDVKNQVIKGKNELSIRFESASKRGRELASKLSYTLPEGERVFTRKAQYQYGWDFMPRLLTCGLWKPVRLHFYTAGRIRNANYIIKQLNKEKAELAIGLDLVNCAKGEYTLSVELIGTTFKKQKQVKNLAEVNGTDTIFLTVDQPKLWWCIGLGEPFLYKLKTVLRSKKGVEDSLQIEMGIRKIELVREVDSIGSSFYFRLNDVPVFIKGANLVPSGPLLKRSLSDETLVKKASDVGMNMLRVWGGGVYGSDELYKACDKNGILIWQDMAFACAMYSGDQTFMNSVTEETIDQFKRIRTHPSLALICGNNESDEGWNNWGWQKQFKYSYQDSLVIWNDYQKLFHALIPQLCSELMPGLPYHYSSPSIGWGHPESLRQADSHYWGVWWGMEPFEEYRNKVGRFASEYGFQSLPDIKTIQSFCPNEQIQITSPAIQSHQKHKKGFETIKAYMQRDYAVPDSLIQFAYVSQLLQRDGMKIAIEAHRSAKPNCMGTLFWQFNDAWPAISWSAVDYFGKPKAFYYSLQQNFSKFMLSAVLKTRQIEISLVSDSINLVHGEIQLQLKNFKGDRLWEKSVQSMVNYSSAVHYIIQRNEMPNFDSSSTYLQIKFKIGQRYLAGNNLFFTAPKNLKLPKAKIYFEKQNNQSLLVSSNVFAKDVFLYSDKGDLNVSDNYFDLEPGIKKVIPLLPGKPFPQLSDIRVIVLNNL